MEWKSLCMSSVTLLENGSFTCRHALSNLQFLFDGGGKCIWLCMKKVITDVWSREITFQLLLLSEIVAACWTLNNICEIKKGHLLPEWNMKQADLPEPDRVGLLVFRVHRHHNAQIVTGCTASFNFHLLDLAFLKK